MLYLMMTSSNGNIFRVTGYLCGEFTGHRWIPAQRPVARSFGVFFCAWINSWVNNREAGDLRHHRAHYDVTVMYLCKADMSSRHFHPAGSSPLPRKYTLSPHHTRGCGTVQTSCNYSRLLRTKTPSYHGGEVSRRPGENGESSGLYHTIHELELSGILNIFRPLCIYNGWNVIHGVEVSRTHEGNEKFYGWNKLHESEVEQLKEIMNLIDQICFTMAVYFENLEEVKNVMVQRKPAAPFGNRFYLFLNIETFYDNNLGKISQNMTGFTPAFHYHHCSPSEITILKVICIK